MNLSVFERTLGAELRKPLDDLGFRSQGVLDFLRKTPFGGETLRFGGRMDDQQLCKISGTAGIFFRSVEHLLNPGRSPGSLSPTIMVPLHLLHEDHEYFEWIMGRVEDAPLVATEIVAEAEEYALPFFERYSQIEEVKQRLESPNPADWFVLTPEQRVMILAAIEQVTGYTEKALRLIDEALADRADALPKRRLPLEKLRAEIVNSLESSSQ